MKCGCIMTQEQPEEYMEPHHERVYMPRVESVDVLQLMGSFQRGKRCDGICYLKTNQVILYKTP